MSPRPSIVLLFSHRGADLRVGVPQPEQRIDDPLLLPLVREVPIPELRRSWHPARRPVPTRPNRPPRPEAGSRSHRNRRARPPPHNGTYRWGPRLWRPALRGRSVGGIRLWSVRRPSAASAQLSEPACPPAPDGNNPAERGDPGPLPASARRRPSGAAPPVVPPPAPPERGAQRNTTGRESWWPGTDRPPEGGPFRHGRVLR